ncbi:N-acetylmuramoyl-L-alanine amidase CwlD [Clostridium guangxiense]|uniref:N-acetylmuramoyl-L-alanine amidase CwlD n=1 Tax=Clostridium guangxiense TaxID=1662055 RepID=UPI0022AA028F|nr:N-acetylmuramoyl-L-alanine amidase CwlD [Clostridium guangxiense]
MRFISCKIRRVIVLILLLSFIFPYKIIYAKGSNEAPKIILIDPGHGGIDGGAQAKDGTCEKDINLNISLKLKKYLESKKFKVIMTRQEDKGLYTEGGKIRKKKLEDLENRCKIKLNSNCDAFISIHLNMFPQTQYYGAQVWYGDNEKSEKLAGIIQRNAIDDLDKSNRRKEKPAKNSYKILRYGKDIPSVIVECGFLSNDAERQKLKDVNYQQKIADSIGKSVEEFFKELD